MLLSMTGFGEGRSESETIAVTAEVRSINNRHLKISYRSSDGYHGLEQQVEKLVREGIRRGTVQLNVRIDRRREANDYRINSDVLLGYQEQLSQLGGVHSQPTIDKLLTLPGVISTSDASGADPEGDWPTIQAALAAALKSHGEMRLREGEALAVDLRSQAETINSELAGVTERSPLVADAYRDRLQERISQALEKVGVTLEPSDLVREVALFVDRSDISEEIVRLRSHLEQFEARLISADRSPYAADRWVYRYGQEETGETCFWAAARTDGAKPEGSDCRPRSAGRRGGWRAGRAGGGPVAA